MTPRWPRVTSSCYQDIRGKYGSEGNYVMTLPLTRAAQSHRGGSLHGCYDTIDWLVKNVPGNNGQRRHHRRFV